MAGWEGGRLSRILLSAVAIEYQVLLDHFPHLTVAPLSRSAVLRAAELRAAYRVSPADALQVAACLEAGATAFVTNDRALRRVTEITIILLEDFIEDVAMREARAPPERP